MDLFGKQSSNTDRKLFDVEIARSLRQGLSKATGFGERLATRDKFHRETRKLSHFFFTSAGLQSSRRLMEKGKGALRFSNLQHAQRLKDDKHSPVIGFADRSD